MAFDLDNEELKATRKLHNQDDGLYEETSDKDVENIEEDVKILKNAIKCNKKQFENLGTHILLQDDEQEAIEHILAEREQMLKEKQDDKQDIKDFQNALNEENLRCANYAIENNEFKKRIQELEEENRKFKTIDYLYKIDSDENRCDIKKIYFEWLDSIPKQKVKDKIEKLRYDIELGNCRYPYIEEHKIEILEELLEGDYDK